ncbi:MAG: hypothetical protein NT012_00270 [Candidatus Nealsonbacteria bacterium]|nr:hypothetical protein [Candidatus Nealsonbacteria bacterium]
MEKNKQIATKETPKQREAFLVYFNLEERSLEKLYQHYTKTIPKKAVSLETLKNWSRKFKWQERISIMDQEVFDRAEQIAIKEAIARKSDILKAVKNTMIRYNQAILSGDIIPSASDFKKMWEVARIELGKSIGQEIIPIQAPPINIFLTKNEKIIKVVHEAQEELRKALQGEIKEENQ